ncbi:hypothetical protein [Helicobacter saguini]|uniref:tRNA (guanine(46)-N(7))-methyltransferase n=1 Tax=Helicobacter saguini TaxID=1548018 RepID=A0A6L7DAQ4_9HELI|nr:hypothetical protein [Helicobacter saguini]MWV70271.1 hypothetical protein [Helicobacter saguini]
MPHFISKNMFLCVNISHNDFFIMPYLRNFRHPNLMILPIILESKSQKVAKKNLDSNSLTTKIDSTHEVLFIRCVVKSDRFLYKIDKLTQVSNLNKIKEILSFLASHVDVISHNLSETKKHTKGSNTPFLLKETQLTGLKPHFIEIGFGSGRHILSLAKSNPKKIILGFEIHAPSIRQVLNAIESYQLKNLYICAADARNAMQLIDSSVANAIFLHFPVPWNNAKHRRVMSRDFLLACFRILRLNGHLNLRSDDLEYVRDSINEMLSAPIAHFEVKKIMRRM